MATPECFDSWRASGNLIQLLLPTLSGRTAAESEWFEVNSISQLQLYCISEMDCEISPG